jgi:hypothetical protein
MRLPPPSSAFHARPPRHVSLPGVNIIDEFSCYMLYQIFTKDGLFVVVVVVVLTDVCAVFISRDSCAGKDEEGQSALHHACLGGHLETVRYVTDNGAPDTCNERDCNDMTPFHLACEGGFLEVVVRERKGIFFPFQALAHRMW